VGGVEIPKQATQEQVVLVVVVEEPLTLPGLLGLPATLLVLLHLKEITVATVLIPFQVEPVVVVEPTVLVEMALLEPLLSQVEPAVLENLHQLQDHQSLGLVAAVDSVQEQADLVVAVEAQLAPEQTREHQELLTPAVAVVVGEPGLRAVLALL
jgi:hypothetical protein